MKEEMIIRFLLLFLILTVKAPSARASECAAVPPVEESYAISSSVFVGKVMMVRERTRNVKVSFKVYKVFKGTLDDVSVVLTSFPNDMGQGYPFQLEEQYLVFTYLQEGRDHANLCTRTKPLSEASADIKALDRILRQEPSVLGGGQEPLPTAAVLPSL